MTAIRKSDSQLDAEAALRKSIVLVMCRSILNDGRPCAIQMLPGDFHRHRMTPSDLYDLYSDESMLLDGGMAPGMTSIQPPVTKVFTESTDQWGRVHYVMDLEEEPADRNGQNLSGALVSLIGGIEVSESHYGPIHPVRRALQEWERACRRRHRPGPSLQWRDHTSGPLCSDLLRAASIGVSLRWCSEAWGVEYPRAERLLEAGLRFIGERIARWQDDQLGIVHDRDRCPVCIEEAQG